MAQYQKITNLKGPEGDKGDRGPAVQAQVRSTTQLPAGEPASVEVENTADGRALFDVRIPKGIDGDPSAVADLDDASSSLVNTQGTKLQTALNAQFDQSFDERTAVPPPPTLDIAFPGRVARRAGDTTSINSAVDMSKPALPSGRVRVQRPTVNLAPNPLWAGFPSGRIYENPIGTGGKWEKRGGHVYDVLSVADSTLRLQIARGGTTETTAGLRGATIPVPDNVTMVSAKAKIRVVSDTGKMTRAYVMVQRYNAAGVFIANHYEQFVDAVHSQAYVLESTVLVDESESLSLNVILELADGGAFTTVLEVSELQLEPIRNRNDATTFTPVSSEGADLTVELPAGNQYMGHLYSDIKAGASVPLSLAGTTATIDGADVAGTVDAAGLIVAPVGADALFLSGMIEERVPPVFEPLPPAPRPIWMNGRYMIVDRPHRPSGHVGPWPGWFIEKAVNRASLERFEIRPGYANDSEATNNTQRSELVSEANGSNSWLVPFGTDLWISHWLKLETPTVAPGTEWRIFAQVRGIDDAGDSRRSPVWALTMTPEGAMQVVTRWSPERAFVGTPTVNNANKTVRWELPDYPPGWHHFVHRIRVERGTGGGWWQGWMDGEEIHNGECGIGYNDERGPHVNHGIYRARSTTEVVAAQHAHFTYGTESLAHHVTAPPVIL